MITYTPVCLQLLADALAETYRDQLRAGIDADGNPFPYGIDLIKTGLLLASIKGVVINGEPTVEVGAPYALYVLPRYNATGLAPQFVTILEQRWQPILAAGLAWVE
jgi:hypothetical protein